MTRPTPDFDWNHARTFLAVADHGSYSSAARVLGLAQPTIGRQMTALEASLGLVLFQRVGQTLALTRAGLDLRDHVRGMRDAATRVALRAAGEDQELEGTVRVAASEAVAAYLLPPIVHALREAHPSITLELVVSNATSDLRRREADVAVRHVRPEGQDLVAKRVAARCDAHLYGAPAYLARLGHPRTADELAARAEVLAFDDTDRMAALLRAAGLPFADGSFGVRTGNHLVQWELAKQGVGLCVMMEAVAAREPALVRALPDARPVYTFPTWLTCHREVRTNRRIRLVFEELAARLFR